MMVSKCSFVLLSSLLVVGSAWSPSSSITRRDVLSTAASAAFLRLDPQVASAKCSDIETCREIGDRKLEREMKEHPLTKLPASNVHYRVLRPGSGDEVVDKSSTVDLIYSISESNGRYMYSQGFGYEKVNYAGSMQPDLGLDSLVVHMGTKEIPIGIQEALVGMKKGERRRVSLPVVVGFETSNWQPEPTSTRGKLALGNYKNLILGKGGAQLPYPAETVWDVEVLRIKG